jgi:hypothetical protein
MTGGGPVGEGAAQNADPAVALEAAEAINIPEARGSGLRVQSSGDRA